MKTMLRKRTGVSNKFNLTTLYIKPADNDIWMQARENASAAGLSLSQYIIDLVRQDDQRRVEREKGKQGAD